MGSRSRGRAGSRSCSACATRTKTHDNLRRAQVEGEGGLDDTLADILSSAASHGTPVVYALSRRRLGGIYGKPGTA